MESMAWENSLSGRARSTGQPYWAVRDQDAEANSHSDPGARWWRTERAWVLWRGGGGWQRLRIWGGRENRKYVRVRNNLSRILAVKGRKGHFQNWMVALDYGTWAPLQSWDGFVNASALLAGCRARCWRFGKQLRAAALPSRNSSFPPHDYSHHYHPQKVNS